MRSSTIVVLAFAFAALFAVSVVAETHMTSGLEVENVVQVFKAWLKRHAHKISDLPLLGKMFKAFKSNAKMINQINAMNKDNPSPHAVLSISGPNVGLTDEQLAKRFGGFIPAVKLNQRLTGKRSVLEVEETEQAKKTKPKKVPFLSPLAFCDY